MNNNQIIRLLKDAGVNDHSYKNISLNDIENILAAVLTGEQPSDLQTLNNTLKQTWQENTSADNFNIIIAANALYAFALINYLSVSAEVSLEKYIRILAENTTRTEGKKPTTQMNLVEGAQNARLQMASTNQDITYIDQAMEQIDYFWVSNENGVGYKHYQDLSAAEQERILLDIAGITKHFYGAPTLGEVGKRVIMNILDKVAARSDSFIQEVAVARNIALRENYKMISTVADLVKFNEEAADPNKNWSMEQRIAINYLVLANCLDQKNQPLIVTALTEIAQLRGLSVAELLTEKDQQCLSSQDKTPTLLEIINGIYKERKMAGTQLGVLMTDNNFHYANDYGFALNSEN